MNRKAGKPLPDTVAAAFGASAEAYEAHAKVQRECADELLSLLDRLRPQLPDGPVLEIGCGTGFVTAGLLRRLGDRPMDITDLSPEMVAYCRMKLSALIAGAGSVAFRTLDAHDLQGMKEKYALIVGGFVLQWLSDPGEGLRGLYRALRPGGCLLLSFPTSRSFPEWREVCGGLGLPYPGNPLPEPEILKKTFPDSSTVCFTMESTFREAFPHPASFFRALKAIGADVSLHGGRMPPSQMRRLLRAWERNSPGGISVQYHVVLGGLQRKR